MSKFKVYFQMYGRKMVKEIEALSEFDAREKVRDAISIDEVRHVCFIKRAGDNIMDSFTQILKGFKVG